MSRPEPVIVPEETDLTRTYWEGARNGELWIQSCARCGVAVHPPQPTCPRCRTAGELNWGVASGRGTIYAATVVEHPAHRAVTPWVPYTVLLVRLEEGPLLITAPSPQLRRRRWPVGTKVDFRFEPVARTQVSLPYVIEASSEQAG